MEGNQLLRPQHRVLIAAAVFAFVAVGIFLVVLKWPEFFGMEPNASAPERELTTEEKLEVLEQVNASGREGSTQDASLTTAEEAERQRVMEQVSASSESQASAGGEPDESGFTQEEKMDILDSLNAE